MSQISSQLGSALKCGPQDIVLCTILFLRASSKILLLTERTDKYDFLGPLMDSNSALLEFNEKAEFPLILRCRFDDFIDKPFVALP